MDNLFRVNASHTFLPLWAVCVGFSSPSGNVAGFVLHRILKLIVIPKVRTSVNLHHKTVIFLKGLAYCIGQISPLHPSRWQCTLENLLVQFLVFGL